MGHAWLVAGGWRGERVGGGKVGVVVCEACEGFGTSEADNQRGEGENGWRGDRDRRSEEGNGEVGGHDSVE